MSVPIPPLPADLAPAVPPKLRTYVYFTAFGVGAVGSMVVGIMGVVQAGGSPAAMTAGIVGVVVATVSTVAGMLGAAFRPTAGMVSSKSAKINGDTWGDGSPVTEPVIPAIVPSVSEVVRANT